MRKRLMSAGREVGQWFLGAGLSGVLALGCSSTADTTGPLEGSGGTGATDTGGSGGTDTGGSGGSAAGGSGGSAAGGSGGSAAGGSGGSAAGGSGGSAAGGSGGVATGGTAGSTSGGSGGSGGATPLLRFVAIGDAGEGNPLQYKVSAAIEQECATRGGCAFSLYLGDNFYDVGVDSVNDTQFQTKFEDVYANLNFPFYITLGNHDYGAGGSGLDLTKGQIYLDYANLSTKWYMPAQYYKVSHPGADFYALDTNRIFLAGSVEQLNWLRTETSQSSATWKFAFGHHPYISNGRHGNAGSYEGIPFIPIISGGNVKTFIEEGVCGNVDVFISGHDHNMQWLQPRCGTEFIVSGAGAKHTDLEGRGTPTFFENDDLGGFLLIEIQGNNLTGWFYDEDGNELFTRSLTKP